MLDIFKRGTKPLQQLQAALQALQPTNEVGGDGTTATIADDAPVPADKAAQIARDEDVVRAALQLCGIDYDALIARDGESVYGQALAQNPQLAAEVLAAPNPVLAALQIAKGFEPVAVFTKQYGRDPAEIKAKIAAETRAAMLAEAGQEPKATTGATLSNLPVQAAGRSRKRTTTEKEQLMDVFGK